MASEEYKESKMAKIVKRLMDEEGFEFGEAVREAMEQTKNFESKADGGSIGIEVLFGPKREEYQTGGQAYSSKATAQDYAKALQNVSAGTTYQQQAAAEKYAKQQANIMLEQAMKSADPSKGPGLQGIYDTFFKNKNTGIGSNVFSPGASGKMISYSSRDKDRILDTMANQMLDTTNYSQTKKRDREAEAKAAQFDAYTKALANKQTQTYGKASDYAAEAMTLGMPVEAYYDYLVTGDEKDLQYKYQQAVDGVTNPYYDAKFSSYSDVYGPDLPRNPYQQYFRNVTDQQTQQGIPTAQRIQQGQVMGLPGASMSSNPAYQSYASLLAANKKMLGLKDGGRVPMVSGGALKAIGSGIMKLFSKGDDVVDLAKQEEIFRSGNITTDFLENVDDKVIEKFIRTRDTKGVGGYGMYDSFAEMPNGLKAAELISRIKTADGGINYEAAELFIGKKLKGDESVDELISMVITEKKADGGRVGLFMGGPALEGQALNIYNSMNSYGFSDEEIANALQGQGLYTPDGVTELRKEPPTTIQPVGFQGDSGGGGKETTGFGDFGNLDPNTEKTFTKNVFTIDKNAKPGDPITGSFKPTDVTGYKNINTGIFQTLDGKNINHGGIPVKPAFAAVIDALGMGVIDETDLTGLPYRDGYIAGTFTGKNPIDFFTNQQKFFKTQQETIADINAKLAEEQKQKELQAKIAAEVAAGKSLSQIGKENFTGAGMAFEAGNTDQGGGFTGGQVKDTGGVPGGKYGSPRKDGGLMFAKGGLASMFTRRR